jgi:hypothetical protein
VVDLVRQVGEVMNNMLEMIQVVIETIKYGTSWSHIKELVDGCFH